MNQTNPEEHGEAEDDGPIEGLFRDETPPRLNATEEAIKGLEGEVAELKDRLLRAVAETENVRKRAERERIEVAKYAVAPFARDLIPVADNLSRALKAVPADQKDNPAISVLIDGIELVERELLAVFERHGIKRIIPNGEPFNANYHQAVAELPSPHATPGTVLDVIEAGYVIDERLIRPAMVVIAKAVGRVPEERNEPGAKLDTSA